MKTLHLRNSFSRSPLPRRSPAIVGRRWACRAVVPRRRDEGGSPITYHYSLLTVLLLALCCFGLSPTAQALLPAPPPDGGYPNGNTAEGAGALFNLTTGTNNTALGGQALYHNTTGGNNAATGFRALYINTSGVNNTATGSQTLLNNTTGSQNTANGYVALSSNTSGGSNTATGSGALRSNTSASHNTATGYISLYKNTTGGFNTADGDRALYSNTTGENNTASGFQALNSNTTGADNTANGTDALLSNTTGGLNTANGERALYSNTTGIENTANGVDALIHNTTGNFNIALGVSAGHNLTTGDFNIDIGNNGVSGDSGTIRIGFSNFQTRAFIAGIRGVTTGNADAVPVVIDSAGQLGTISSSRRFKKEIKAMDQTSQAILGLKPVTFQYKSDPSGTAQFGLIAEEVAEVNPDLVVRDAEGEIYTVRYEAVNAMLLNEFLKEHRLVQELKATVALQEKDFQSRLAEQQKQIKALASGLEKVSAQLEVSKSAPQMAGNDR